MIYVYNGTIIAGQQTGNKVTAGNPIMTGAIARLPHVKVNGSWVALGVRCDHGFRTYEEDARHLRIAISDESINFQLASDVSSPKPAGEPLDFTSEITNVNTIFWVRGIAQEGETPQNDTTVTLQLSGYIEAVS